MCQTVSEAAPTWQKKRKAPVQEAGCHAASSHVIIRHGIIRLHVLQDPAPEEEVWELEASAHEVHVLVYMYIRNNTPRIGGIAAHSCSACRGSAGAGAGGAWPACSRTRLVM